MAEPASNSQELVELLLTAKTALFVAAHPDDIEFRASGLVYVMRQLGVDVAFAIATSGGKGLIWPFGTILERLRERHQHRAADILGGVDVVLCSYPDGRLSDYVESLTADLRSLVDSRKPDVLLCWDPEYNLNPHPDHQAAARAVRGVCFDGLACWYGSSEPNLRVGFGEETLRAKIRSIKAHRTESPWFYFDLRIKGPMIAAMRAEGSKIGSDYAETFRLIQPHQ